MLSIRNSADMARALTYPLDPILRALLTDRRDQLLTDLPGTDLGELVHIIVADAADTITAIEGVAGVALATNPIDGSRLGEPSFTHCFEYVARHDGWLEAVLILSDDGFGVVLLVPDMPGEVRRLVTA